MFIFIVCLLFCIAFLLSLRSLRAELKKSIKTHEVAASLAKGRVLFIAESSAKEKEKEHIPQGVPEIHPLTRTETHAVSSVTHPHNQELSDVRHELSQLSTNSQEHSLDNGGE